MRMYTSLGDGHRHYIAYHWGHRGQEGYSEEVTGKLKTQHKLDMRRGKTAFSMDETARAKTLRRELFKPKRGREPSVAEPRNREQTR